MCEKLRAELKELAEAYEWYMWNDWPKLPVPSNTRDEWSSRDEDWQVARGHLERAKAALASAE